jgi:AsmA protein
MKTFFKITASLVTLVFTVVLVAFIYILNLEPNDHKPWLADRIRASTGLDVDFNGNIGVSFYPWVGVTLDDVVVHNPEGFSDNPLLQADHVALRAKLVPLLSQEYEIDTIVLTGTRVYLETDAVGRANWNAAMPPADDSTGTTDSGAALNNLVIGGVDISNAALVYDDRFNGVRYDIENLNAATGELIYGEPLALTLGLDASASQPALAASLNLTGTILYDLDNERYDLNPLSLRGTLRGANVPGGSADIAMGTAVSVDLASDTMTLRDFTFNALDAQVNANINARDITGNAPLYQVNFAAAGNDLAVLFRILENEELVRQITSLGSRSFALSGLMEASPAAGNVSIMNLDAALLDATITGNVQASNLQSGNPVLVGALNASGPDLPSLLEVAGQFQGGRDSELARYGRELQQSPDQSFLVRTEFDANLQTGNIAVPELEIQALGATITGNVTARNANTETPVLQGRLNASGPDLPLLMQIAGQITGGRDAALNTYGRQLRGVGNRRFAVNAPFDINMANGNIDISGLDASFLGFTLNGNLQARNFETANGTMNGRLSLTGRDLQEVLNAIEQPDLAEVVQSISLQIVIDGGRSNLGINPMNLDVVLSGPRIPNAPVTLGLNSNAVINLDNDSLNVDAFSLAGLGLALSGNVQVSNLQNDPGFSGQVNLPPFNLRRFMQQLNLALPATTDNSVFQNVAFNSAFSGSASNLRLNNLVTILDDTRMAGNVTLAGLDTAPAYDVDLDITGINLDRYLAPATDSPQAAAAASTELPLETLRSLNIKGNVHVEQLTYSNLKLQNVTLGINASDGELALAPMTASLYEGTYNGDIRLDARSDTPVASVDTALTGINLAPLLRDFMDANYVSGTGNIQLALTGRGADTATIKRNLNGNGSLDLEDGVLQGVDVGGVLRQVESMIREQRARTVARGESTPFDAFSANINIQNGVVTTNDLLIKSSGFDVSGRGTLANLTNDSINFNLVANVDETPASDEQSYDIGGYSLPIACTGTFTSPTCLPDIQAIMVSAIQSAVQRGLTNLLERAAGGQTTQQQSPPVQETTDPAAERQQQEEARDPREELLKKALENLFQ